MRFVAEVAAWDCHRQRLMVEVAASDFHPQQTLPQEFPRQQNYLYYSRPRLLQAVRLLRRSRTPRRRPLFFSRLTLHGVTMRHRRKNWVLRCKSFRFRNT